MALSVRPLRVAFALVLATSLLVSTVGAAATPVAAASAGPHATTASDLSTTPATPPGPPARCFPDDGTEFVVGTEGPQVEFTLHTSLLDAVVAAETGANTTNVTNTSNVTSDFNATNGTPAPGAFGIEATASTLSDEIVSLQAGVLYEGVDNVTDFLLDPFEPFALAFDYRLRIPAFEGTMADSEYRESDVPVEGPVEEAACSA